MSRSLFHLAFPVHDLAATKYFYVEGLGCTLGRESSSAITLGLAGNQLVGHRESDEVPVQRGIYPRHFGLVFLDRSDWESLAERACCQGLRFYQQPRVRFSGTRIEHRTFFLEDPSGNLLEFKHYTHESAIFGERDLSTVGDPE
ncbi:MAG: VOC family protein [Nitrospira sp.]|nr:VOC family protein [Nitrospira sp.]